MPELTSEKWEEVRSAYEAGEHTVNAICTRFDVSQKALYVHAENEGWTLRATDRSGPLVGTSAARRRSLASKLSALFEQQLMTIEQQGYGPQRLETLERDCRALELLARTFDRIVQAELRSVIPSPNTPSQNRPPQNGSKGTSSMKSGSEPAHERASSPAMSATTADELRDELAQRLYGLQEQGADTHIAERAEPG